MFNKLSPKQKFLFTVLAVILFCVGWLGRSLWSLGHNKLEMNRLQKKRVLLDKQYESLQDTFQKLQAQDPSTLEHLARTEYNMAKEGELQFRFDPHD